MHKSIVATFLSASLLCSGAVYAGGMSLSSPDVKNKGTIAMEQVFKGFGCSGKNISPALSWKGAPKGTKSFALTVYDPDAPTGSGWWPPVWPRRAACKGAPTTAPRVTADPAHPRATSRIITSSPSTPWTSTRSTRTRMPRRRSSVSIFTPIPWRRGICWDDTDADRARRYA